VIDEIDVIQIEKRLNFAINLTKITVKAGFSSVFQGEKYTSRGAPA
jgi:hypothetical protein